MKIRVINIFCVLVLLSTSAEGQQSNTIVNKDRFLDTVRLGMRYQVQEFHGLNQKLAESCNCDEGQRLKERALQGIVVSILEPLDKRWAVGADFGASFGKVMDDKRNYTHYSFVDMRMEGFYHLLDETAKLRPYLSAGLQLAANSRKALLSIPVGAGLRYSLAKGGTLHVQTAYEGGMGNAIAKNMVTNIGFHVPLYKRKQQSTIAVQLSYDQLLKSKAVDSSLLMAKVEVQQPAVTQVAQIAQAPTLLEELPSTKSPTQLYRIVYFDTDKFSLNKTETSKVLSEAYFFLKKNPAVKAKLSGHTDGLLGRLYNKILSKKRVQAVALWLIRNGIAPERISTYYFGKEAPATSNDNEGGRSGNRRVELFIK